MLVGWIHTDKVNKDFLENLGIQVGPYDEELQQFTECFVFDTILPKLIHRWSPDFNWDLIPVGVDHGDSCPRCGRKQYYTCTKPSCTCNVVVPKGEKPQVHVNSESLGCPYCGFTAHYDYWVNREMVACQPKEE